MSEAKDHASAFFEALNAPETHRSEAKSDQFKRTYRLELASMLIMLNNIGIVSTSSYHPEPPEACDLCDKSLSDLVFFVDGAFGPSRTVKPWANMCAQCYGEQGHGVGWGTGQLYRNRGEGRWQLIAGDRPEGVLPDDEAKSE